MLTSAIILQQLPLNVRFIVQEENVHLIYLIQ